MQKAIIDISHGGNVTSSVFCLKHMILLPKWEQGSAECRIRPFILVIMRRATGLPCGRLGLCHTQQRMEIAVVEPLNDNFHYHVRLKDANYSSKQYTVNQSCRHYQCDLNDAPVVERKMNMKRSLSKCDRSICHTTTTRRTSLRNNIFLGFEKGRTTLSNDDIYKVQTMGYQRRCLKTTTFDKNEMHSSSNSTKEKNTTGKHNNHSKENITSSNSIDDRHRRMYQVLEIKKDGTIHPNVYHISDLLKISGMYARDFLSLHLTTYQQVQQQKNLEEKRRRKAKESLEEEIEKQNTPWYKALYHKIIGPKRLSDTKEGRLREEDASSNNNHRTKSFPYSLNALGPTSSPSYRRPTSAAILPRENKIVVCFGHIRAVIGTNDAMVFEGHESQVKEFASDLSTSLCIHQEEIEHIQQRYDRLHGRKRGHCHYDAKLRYLGEPFELTVLEDILREVCDTYNGRIRFYHPVVENLLSSSSGSKNKSTSQGTTSSRFETSLSNLFSESNDDDFDTAHRLVPLKDSLEHFEMHVLQALNCLTDLLSNDEDMVGLLLTEREYAQQRGQSIDISKHDKVELLLEDYTRQLTTLIQQIQYLKGRVQSHNELISLSLDGYRNRIIRMNLSLSVFSVALASSTAVAGIFGMNLVSGLEDHPTAFYWVSVASAWLGGGICFASFRSLNHRNFHQEAVRRQQEVQTLSTCLMDIGALDFLMKSLENGHQMSRNEFKQKYNQVRSTDQLISDYDVNYLFELLDYEHDGFLGNNDFPSSSQADVEHDMFMDIDKETEEDPTIMKQHSTSKLKLVPHSKSKQHRISDLAKQKRQQVEDATIQRAPPGDCDSET